MRLGPSHFKFAQLKIMQNLVAKCLVHVRNKDRYQQSSTHCMSFRKAVQQRFGWVSKSEKDKCLTISTLVET